MTLKDYKPVFIARLPHHLSFPEPLRLRVGDRFLFLPTVERAIEWLEVPANDRVRGQLQEPLRLLQLAKTSRSPSDVRMAYNAFINGAVRESLLFR